MASWEAVAQEAAEPVARAEALLAAGEHEKLDLHRDPRFALHSASVHPPARTGDAEVAGRAEEVLDPALVEAVNGPGQARSHLFRLDVTELVVVRLGEPADHLVVQSRHGGRGPTRRERR